MGDEVAARINAAVIAELERQHDGAELWFANGVIDGRVDFEALTKAIVAAAFLWQPIETAPKDGTPILIYDPSRSEDLDCIYVVRWTYWLSGAPVERTYGWQEAGGEGFAEYHPTMWMPHPAPPMTHNAPIAQPSAA